MIENEPSDNCDYDNQFNNSKAFLILFDLCDVHVFFLPNNMIKIFLSGRFPVR